MVKKDNLEVSYKDIYNKIQIWYENAKNSYDDLKILNHNAATLATSNNNIPDARIVLVKDITLDGLTFFTNYNSKKSKELENNPQATLLFYWESLKRQLKLQGKIYKTTVEVSRDYFYSRPKESQLSAWSSFQSEKLSDYNELISRYNALKNKYSEEIPYLPNWGGFILQPSYIEFWEEGEHRLHKRSIFEKENMSNKWMQYYLNP